MKLIELLQDLRGLEIHLNASKYAPGKSKVYCIDGALIISEELYEHYRQISDPEDYEKFVESVEVEFIDN